MNRRDFIKRTMFATGSILASQVLGASNFMENKSIKNITKEVFVCLRHEGI